MSSIRTGIELQDNFTPVLDGIMSSVSEAVSGMEQMNQTMNAGIDTSAIVSAASDIDEANASARELTDALQNINAPVINMDQPVTLQVMDAPVQRDVPFQLLANPPPAETVPVTPIVTEDPVIEVPEPVEVPVIPVQDEIVIETPEPIELPVIPSVDNVPQLDVPEEITVPITPVVDGQPDIEVPNELTVPVMAEVTEQPEIDVPESISVPVTPLVTDQPEITVPDELTVPVTPIVTEDPVIEVPDSVTVPATPEITEIPEMDIPEPDLSGVEQYQNIINLAGAALQQIVSIQERINSQSAAMDVLPDDVQSKIAETNAGIRQMQSALDYMRENPFNLDAEAVKLQFDSLNASINQTLQTQKELDAQLQGMTAPPVAVPIHPDVPDPLVDPNQPPVTVPVEWQGDTEVFTSTGLERFNAEVQSANNALNTLNQAQERIAQSASGLDVLPDGATQDINNLGQRLQWVSQRLQQIQSNQLNIGTDAANTGLEQLRSQLDQAISQQNELNSAIESADASRINAAYLQLSRTVSGTERYIRDNTDEQGRFNRAIQEGTNNAQDLTGTIMKAAAAYVSVQTVGNVLNLSDELVQITSRLNLMNDGMQTTEELVGMVYGTAQDARGSLSDMADVVARFGNNAKDAFSSSAEVVAFAGLIQKQMTIAGASTQEASNAMIQLSQGLGSGVLRGEELNSIFEQAPNIIQNIADYLDVPIGKIREMASEGQLTADIVKASIFAATDEINANFEAMPMTWGQVWQSFQNTAIMAFKPVLDRLNALANSDRFQALVTNAVGALAQLADFAVGVFEVMAEVGGFVADNWSIISPIVYGILAALGAYVAYMAVVKAIEAISTGVKIVLAVASYAHAAATGAEASATAAATAAQYGLNKALLACPITWIIVLVIALVALFYAAVAAVNKFAGTSISATGIIASVFAMLGAYLYNVFAGIWNVVAAFVEFLVNVWTNPEYAIKAFLVNIGHAYINFALSCINGMQTAAGIIVGVWFGIGAAVHNIIAVMVNGFASFVEAIVNMWNSGCYMIQSAFVAIASIVLKVAESILGTMGGLVSSVINGIVAAVNAALSGINSIIDTVNMIPGVEIGHIGTMEEVDFDFGASAMADAQADLESWLGDEPEKWSAPWDEWEQQDLGDAFEAGQSFGADMIDGARETLNNANTAMDEWLGEAPEDYWKAPTMDYIDLSDAAEAGYAFGEGLEDQITGFDPSNLFNVDVPNPEDFANNLDDIANNTGSMADSLDISTENLKYLRDIAEQEAVNRYTTAEIHIEQTNNNNISSDMDLDGVVEGLTGAVNEAVDEITEGVHD